VTAIDPDSLTLSASFDRNGLFLADLDLITPGNNWVSW
jgi:hypothetical protein